jgi:transcriptional regulator with XRE-family HTH domain
MNFILRDNFADKISLDIPEMLYKLIQQKGGEIMIAKAFGNYFKQKRIGLGLTLREFCRIHELDPGNISKLERGLSKPPQSQESLAKYAAMLQIKESSEEWCEFSDLAATSAGKIPEDIISNEEIMSALPVLFRTARKENLNEEALVKLVSAIKKDLR